MEILLERCAGLDVRQAGVVCRVLIGTPGRKAQKLQGRFGTTTRELETMRAWLAGHGVAHIGMESTGVCWKPVYAVLEGHVELIVGNTRHIKSVPGRKTDVKDAEWIARLVRHRRTLIETRTAVRNRVLKLLEGANIKLSGVARDVFRVSGMAMREALAAGTNNAAEMAGLARGRMRRKWVTAASTIAEIGTDMDVFATARRLAAWAGVALRAITGARASRRAQARGRRHAPGQRVPVIGAVAAASAAVRAKGSHDRDTYNRLRARRGPVRAIMAVARKLGTGKAFRDPGESCLDQAARKRSTTKLVMSSKAE